MILNKEIATVIIVFNVLLATAQKNVNVKEDTTNVKYLQDITVVGKNSKND